MLFNRSRAYGRGFCEGVAAYTEVRHDWRLEMVEEGRLGKLDGLIAHVAKVYVNGTYAGGEISATTP